MIRTACKTLIVLFAGLFFASIAFADPKVGELLEEALNSRTTGTVTEVSDRFDAAVDSTTNFEQKAKMLFIFSDYLFENHEWEKALQVQYRVLNLGDRTDQPTAYYNLIWANLELGRNEDAQKAAVQLNKCPSAQYMRDNALIMKSLSPDGIHARISEVLLSAGTVQAPVAVATDSHEPVEAPAYEKITPEVTEKAIQSLDKRPPVIVLQAGSWNSALKGNIDSQGMILSFSDDLSADRQTSVVISAEAALSMRDSVKLTYVNF
ncbi:MAG: hypothetical protein PHD82_10435, partial [Candidatus Riflebacteria bacterium]|nr:hypothetical protein [Candidatus Riflebacteria bacterium]